MPNIYAAGDVVGPYQFTHVAGVIENYTNRYYIFTQFIFIITG